MPMQIIPCQNVDAAVLRPEAILRDLTFCSSYSSPTPLLGWRPWPHSSSRCAFRRLSSRYSFSSHHSHSLESFSSFSPPAMKYPSPLPRLLSFPAWSPSAVGFSTRILLVFLQEAHSLRRRKLALGSHSPEIECCCIRIFVFCPVLYCHDCLGNCNYWCAIQGRFGRPSFVLCSSPEWWLCCLWSGPNVCDTHPPNPILIVALVLGFYWTQQVIQNVVHFTITAVSLDPGGFSPIGDPSCCSPTVMSSLSRALTYSFGSICFGSLIVSIIKVLEYSARFSHRNERACGIDGCILQVRFCVVTAEIPKIQWTDHRCFRSPHACNSG